MTDTFDPLVTPWEVREADFPDSGPLKEKAAFLLRYAVLAPSPYNTQPWVFEAFADGFVLRADKSRRRPSADPDDRELLMGCGAALFNLRVAAARFGLGCKIDYGPPPSAPEVLAFIRFAHVAAPDPALGALFEGIPRRRTNRAAYDALPLDSRRLNALAAPQGSGAGILLVNTPGLKRRLADLVAEGDRLLYADPGFRGELGRWVRSDWTPKGDGMPGRELRLPGLLSTLAAWFLMRVDTGPWQARRDHQLVEKAGVVAVVFGKDEPAALLEAGELLERFLLSLTMQRLQYAFVNQPMQAAILRPRLRALLGLEQWPQVMLRVGTAAELKRAAPRRRVREVLREP